MMANWYKKYLSSAWNITMPTLIYPLMIIVGCSQNTAGPATSSQSAGSKTFIRGPVSCSNKYDMVTTYAVFIGRAAACRESFDDPMKYVGDWIDTCFDDHKDRSMQLVIFANAVKYHAENQKNGNSPDSCSSVAKTFYSITWPDKSSGTHAPDIQQPSKTGQTNQPYKLEDLPYIDKEKGIDTTIGKHGDKT